MGRTDNQGGAARGMQGLHRGLMALGVDSHVVCARKFTHDANVIAPQGLQGLATRVAPRLDRAVARVRSGDVADDFRANIVGSPLRGMIRNLRPDVVNLHWVAEATLSLRQIASMAGPTVWTARDMWPFTGGCHYCGDCRNFETGCGSCPLLQRPAQDDLSFRMLQRRVRLSGQRLTLVALSGWLKQEIGLSHAFREFDVRVIPPGIDVATFVPQPQRLQELRRSDDELVVGFFSAAGVLDHRKGYSLLTQAISAVSEKHPDLRICLLVVGGGASNADLSRTVRVLDHGRVGTDNELTQLYSSCDVVVVPSLQEAFGKVAVEAQACGAPVVCFEGTGVADAVSHEQTGLLARLGRPDSLAAELEKLILSNDLRTRMSRAARSRAVEHFSQEEQARKYRGLYEELVDVAA